MHIFKHSIKRPRHSKSKFKLRIYKEPRKPGIQIAQKLEDWKNDMVYQYGTRGMEKIVAPIGSGRVSCPPSDAKPTPEWDLDSALFITTLAGTIATHVAALKKLTGFKLIVGRQHPDELDSVL